MLVRDINTLPLLDKEIIYIDEKTGNKVSGIVMYKEIVNEHLAFVYVASPYKDENIHEDYGFKYKDIMINMNAMLGLGRHNYSQEQLNKISNMKKKYNIK